MRRSSPIYCINTLLTHISKYFMICNDFKNSLEPSWGTWKNLFCWLVADTDVFDHPDIGLVEKDLRL